MPTLNLKEYYPTAHSKDFFVEVSEDIHQFFLDAKCKENAFVRQVSRYHAYYSLDDPDFVVEQSLRKLLLILLNVSTISGILIGKFRHCRPNRLTGSMAIIILDFPCRI